MNYIDNLQNVKHIWKGMIWMEKIMTKRGFVIDKVNVDLTRNMGNDQYSDGDIENEILEFVRSQQADTLLHNDNRWPIIYHLSPARENIVSWIPFKKTDSVLEIGSGCGAVSGIMAEKAGKLDCVEISPRRAEISAWRNHQYGNMTIHVGNLNDMNFEEKFDYVTLIGVLEYAGTFTHTNNPYEDFLIACCRFLKPSGTLIIAIENRLGMKYWSGAHEDHTGKRFDGILDYQNEKNQIRTFARKELASLLTAVGLNEQFWYYPYPDYKLPLEIHSNNYLPTSVDIHHFDLSVFDRDRIELFPEVEAMASICEAGLYNEFANSFLVLCQDGNKRSKNMKLPEYVHYTARRNRKYEVITEIWKEKGNYVVYKKPQSKEALSHLHTIAENCQILSAELGIKHVAQAKLLTPDLLQMEYVEGRSFMELILAGLLEGGVDVFQGYINYYINNILPNNQSFNIDKYDGSVENSQRKYNVDLNFENIRVRDGNFVVIDYEWMLPEISNKYVLFRALFYLVHEHGDFLRQYGLSLDTLLANVGITTYDVDLYHIMEEKFYSNIADDYYSRYKKKRISVNINI